VSKTVDFASAVSIVAACFSGPIRPDEFYVSDFVLAFAGNGADHSIRESTIRCSQ
jgi:hypothetical protein